MNPFYLFLSSLPLTFAQLAGSGPCASADISCLVSAEEGYGFKPAAASYIATASLPTQAIFDLYKGVVSATDLATLPNPTDGPAAASYLLGLATRIPSSEGAQVTAYLQGVLNIQATASAGSGGNAGAGGAGSSGAAPASTTSHAGAARETGMMAAAAVGAAAGAMGMLMGL